MLWLYIDKAEYKAFRRTFTCTVIIRRTLNHGSSVYPYCKWLVMTCFCLCRKLKSRPDDQTPCHSSFSGGIICGQHRGSFQVRNHLRSNLETIFGLGIICSRGSFAALCRPLKEHYHVFAHAGEFDFRTGG